ncbi:MAG: DedA family protein [Chloroflexi bacterium]|nr:MAG: DedA family protein [Chloroflexota bacterium]TME96806.1 MAG: DedA family protein [Chloroflexota bacterium]
MTATLSSLVSHYGVLAVLLLMAAESCGIPFPSEVIMPSAGVLAATGHMNLAEAILAGAAGNLLGSLVAFALAARFGEPLLLGPGRWIGIRAHHLELADGWFQRWGLWAVFLGRVLPVVRTYISFPAGLARINLVWFSVLTFVGALPWCAALALVGYTLGKNYDRVSGPIQLAAVVIAVLVAMVVVVWYLRGRSTAR